MNDNDRLRLLFGPYRAPALRKGDRAFCLLRDCDVVVTSWTDARIPWPRCRALDRPGGAGGGILLDEELARAVRNESAAAVMHWWGVTAGVVWRWRKALGVGRTGNPGTTRLIRAASASGAAAVQDKEWTEEERELCRRNNAALGLAANLTPGYHGPLWTPEETALLGTAPDAEVAKRIGRTPNAVRLMREQLGIPRLTGGRWREDELALLGTVSDNEVARKLGRSLSSVVQKRCILGIPTFRDRRRKEVDSSQAE